MDDDLRSFLLTIELEEHAQAFDDQGYTSLLVLRSLTKTELSEAATAAQMLPGHVAKLRFHLQQDAGLSPVAPAPGGGTGAADNVPAGPGPAPPPPPPQQQQPQPPPPPQPEQPALEPDLEAQQEFARKILATSTLGALVNGNLHTVLNNGTGTSCITLFKRKRYGCSVCPRNKKAADGTRASGDSYGNLLHHLGSREHFAAHRASAYGLPFDEQAWDRFALGNKVSGRGQTSKQAEKRKAVSTAAGTSRGPRSSRPQPRSGRATPPPSMPAAAAPSPQPGSSPGSPPMPTPPQPSGMGHPPPIVTPPPSHAQQRPFPYCRPGFGWENNTATASMAPPPPSALGPLPSLREIHAYAQRYTSPVPPEGPPPVPPGTPPTMVAPGYFGCESPMEMTYYEQRAASVSWKEDEVEVAAEPVAAEAPAGADQAREAPAAPAAADAADATDATDAATVHGDAATRTDAAASADEAPAPAPAPTPVPLPPAPVPSQPPVVVVAPAEQLAPVTPATAPAAVATALAQVPNLGWATQIQGGFAHTGHRSY